VREERVKFVEVNNNNALKRKREEGRLIRMRTNANDQDLVVNTRRGNEEEEEARTPLNENEKDAAWALEEFQWDSDRAIGKKITAATTPATSHSLTTTTTTTTTAATSFGGNGETEKGGGARRTAMMTMKCDEEDEYGDVNDLRHSPRFRPMVRTSEDAKRDKRKYLLEEQQRKENDSNAEDGGGTRRIAANVNNIARNNNATTTTSTAGAGTDFTPMKLRTEEAKGTKYRVVNHKVFCKVEGCSTECTSLYSIRVKVCALHLKADEVFFNNEPSRFCQKCTKFHNVGAFENNRRACLRSLNRLASKRVPLIAQESAANTLAAYERLMMLHAESHGAAPNEDASGVSGNKGKDKVSSVLPSLELFHQQQIRDQLKAHGAKWHQGSVSRRRGVKEKMEDEEKQKQELKLLENQTQRQLQKQKPNAIEPTLNTSGINHFRLQCAQVLLNHLPETFDPLKDAEERRRKEIINGSYSRSEIYDRLMQLDNEAFVTLAAEIKIHNKQPHDLGASIGEGVKNYFVEKSGHPPARLEITAEPGCTKLNVDALIPPTKTRPSFLRNRREPTDQDAAARLASCAIEADNRGLDDVDVDVIVGSVRMRRIDGEWENSAKLRHKHICSSVKHVMCTNPDVLNSRENENTLIITGVPPDVEAIVRINGQVERGSVTARFGGNVQMTKTPTKTRSSRLNPSNNRIDPQREQPDVLQNSQSNYVYVSVPLDYAEGLMTISLLWQDAHEFAGSAVCDPIVVILSPDVDLAQEMKEAMEEVHALSSEFCYTLKRYIGACLVKDRDVRSFTNPNFCTVQKDITLWALRNGFARLSRRLLEPQVQMLEDVRSLSAADGVYKTYVYAATLSDSVDIVRAVIAIGGEDNLFGTVSTIGNKETRDTALHIAAMNGNIDMVLDFLSIISSIDHWFTLRNSSGFSPRDCAVLAQSSNLSRTIAKVLDDPLLIASNAVCLAVKEVVAKVESGAHPAPAHAPAIDHMEELENQSQAIFARASDLIFESLTEISSNIPENMHEEARKQGTVRLLEITNRLLQDNACFLKLFSLAIERDCKLLENYSGADSTDNSFDSPILSGADSFFVQLLESSEITRGRRVMPQSVRKVLGKWSNAIASLKYKSILAFDDPLIEKAYVLENSFYRKRVDLAAFLLIFSVICARKYRYSDGSFVDFMRSFFRVGEAPKWSSYIACLIGVFSFPGVIFALLVYPKFYTRHREGITVLIRLTSPLMWSVRLANETVPVSMIRVMLLRLSSCVYGCRFERHLMSMMINYFIPISQIIEMFSGQAADTQASVVKELDRYGPNKILSLVSIYVNAIISFFIEVRFRRKFAEKYGVDWMKRSWTRSTQSPPRKNEKFIKDIREEVGAVDDDECCPRHRSLASRNRFFEFISARRKMLHAKAYYAFSNPRDEDAYVLENSNFRRPYDITVYGILYTFWGIGAYRQHAKWGSFDWFSLSLFTNCDVNNDTMRITDYDKHISALLLLKLFAYMVLMGTVLVAIFLPRVYCCNRESFISVVKLICGVAPHLKVSETPDFLVVLILRLCAVLWSVRFEREVTFILMNLFITPRALEWYVGTEEYVATNDVGNSTIVACKGNSSSLFMGIFSGKWYAWSFFFKCAAVILVYLQINVISTIEKQRREAFAEKRRIKLH